MAEPSGEDLWQVGAELVDVLVAAERVDAFLAEIGRRGLGTVGGASSCGVTVRASTGSRLLTATTDDVAAQMDEVQYHVDDGPGLTCLREGTAVAVADVAGDRRWPQFSRRGRQAGVGASLSVPMVVGNRAVGALNLYARRPHALTADDHRRAQRFADGAAAAVALGARLHDRDEQARNLVVALQSRTTIDQALGVLMARYAIPAGEAFTVLRRRSQATNVPLRDIAEQIVTGITRTRS